MNLNCVRWKLENRVKVLQYNKDYYRKNKHNGKWKYLKQPAKEKVKPKNTSLLVRTYGEFIIIF